MNKKLLLALLLTFVVIAAGMAPHAQAAPLQFKSPLKPGKNVVKYQGEAASAAFAQSSDSCIYADAQVFVNANTAKNQNTASVYLYTNRYDVCNNYWLGGGFGSAQIAPAAFQLDKQLNSARLQTTVPMIDGQSGAAFTATVDLTWTGVGDTTQSKSRYENQTPGCKYKSSFDGTSRQATATGTVSDGVTNFAAGSSVFANLQSVKSGEVTIGCGF